MTTPTDAPPSYDTVADSSKAYATRNGIPPEHRRSMEDEARPLPPGWIRQFDSKTNHQFFVDTKTDPPRSIWHHPYDDDEYLATLPPYEREHITRLQRSVSMKDIEAESSDDEAGPSSARKGSTATTGGEDIGGVHRFGRRLKDKLTSSSHEEREAGRRRREEEERKAYRAHLAARQAMARAIETGQPQYVGKDHQGRDVYIEPPYGAMAPMGAYGYNPYAQGPYADPNARFYRPQVPYRRPYGYGYGGGLGLPLAGGILGGAMLGGLLF
ncbi:hypothetical protein W97_01940 [Coniosporium apollinis CBS 100218]|uniref:WW domain-containing protein n=1 Tax=Coniosporium apollinis (strain CBS 100218) TaxID=1168221 RepID=R7YM58_CONA1|nr:uncharacterized protein W97_01940 [Coniosporium apollinis CBS 100218]EON62716.1 hypothetical protein W97_01940 [Coniosporium apollinis CBS 100218]